MSIAKSQQCDIFSERLRVIQGERSQREFAAWIGESYKRINHYLNGVSSPAIDFLVKLSEKGINVNWFLTGKGPVHIERPQNDSLPANIQVLLNEVEKIPAIVDDLTAVVRSKREMEESFEVVKNLLKRSKKGSEEKHKTP